MNRSILLGILCAIFVAWNASSVRAQTQSAAPASPSGSPSQSTASSQDQSSSTSTPSAAPQKKVWTNDDMGALHSDPSVANFQPKSGNGGKKGAGANGNSHGRDSNWYRQQIVKLQQQIPPIDAKIAELQKGVNGGTVNDPTTSSRPYGGVHPGSWQQQIADLQSKKEGIEAKISSLEDEARHAGISPNDIP
jgi:hypothetical protein